MSAEENSNQNSPDQYDLKNPKDREALRRAGDDLLKNASGKEFGEGTAPEITDDVDMPVPDLAALEAENADLKDQIMRIAADMENLRRRTVRDVADARSYSVASFARDMLSVSDNLSRALDAIPEDSRESDAVIKAIAEGVEMTNRSMIAALQKHGVEKMEPCGQKFDPHFHQAMFEVEDVDVPVNTIKQVVQAGYMIGDRVLRPAMVAVAKGGPKTEIQPEKVSEEIPEENSQGI